MDALLFALLHVTEARSLPSPQPIALSQTYTPPDRGIPNRRIGAGTR